MAKLFPSILPSGDDFVDDEYSREELQRKDWQELRGLAKEHPSDEINGHSEKEEVIDFLTGEERL